VQQQRKRRKNENGGRRSKKDNGGRRMKKESKFDLKTEMTVFKRESLRGSKKK
jgi:hypothetical protein